jgi:hypothetical protein
MNGKKSLLVGRHSVILNATTDKVIPDTLPVVL